MEDKFSALKFVVTKLSGKYCSSSQIISGSQSSIANPLPEVFAGDTNRISYFLMGIDIDVLDGNGNIVDFCFFGLNNLPGFSPDYSVLRPRFLDWVNRARALVANERTQILQPDPLSVITLSYDPSGNEFGLSPLDAAVKVRNFLKNNIDENICLM